ncbi:transposon Tf2-6 polyprotein [Trichonephila clavipes]|uniref:Transposon Tf2-6 polyprotein n=1 Tax=Trichonephila clavipes TaxID=2585209 RepID=A0A8X6SGE4_TRICX|nr:transposon Tf2-6 polyprotein [Trichonephila clavipes]
MRALRPIPTSAHSNCSMFVPTNLKSCSHIFLRVDRVQPPLSQNYTGPHEVIRRTDKVFAILINGKMKVVSIDRVKPAYVWDGTMIFLLLEYQNNKLMKLIRFQKTKPCLT